MTNVKDKKSNKSNKRGRGSWLGAYFTVEAALVIPLVMATIVFLMYMMFYQYNRCLMEQDLGILLVKGSTNESESAEERVQRTSANEAKRNYDKYLMWEKGEVTATQVRNKLLVKQKGQMMFPFADWQIKGVASVWTSEAEYKCNLLSPTFFVRSYQKLVKNTQED